MPSFARQQDFPQTVFYPSMVANLQLRFDEGLSLVAGAQAAEDLAGGDAQPSAAAQGDTSDQPVITSSGADNLTQIIGIVPRNATVELPGYRQAGTFSLELEFRDLPLDPRVIRAMAVAMHLDAVPAGDFAEGMTTTPAFGDGSAESGTRRASIIETNEDNILIAGLADTITVDHGSSAALVHIQGRDFRGILLDTPVSPKTLASIDLSRPIDRVVEHIVRDLHPQGGGIKVRTNQTEWPDNLIPAPLTVDDATRVNLDSFGNNLRASAKGEAQNVTFWDLITSYCFLVGGVPHFVGNTLRIRPARTLFDARKQEDTFDPAVGTPFADGQPRNVSPPQARSAEQYAYRRLVFGRDIETLKFERKLTGVKVPVIEVVSYDTSGDTRGEGRLLKAQFPPSNEKAARTTSVPPSGKSPETSVIRVNAPGIKNKDRLLEIAKDLYQEIGRQEMGGSAETKNLTSFGGNNDDPDLVRLRPGDPVEFRVDASGLGVFPPPINELTNEEGRSFEEQVEAVKQRVGDENLARVLVAANRGEVADLQRTFRVANVSYSWSKDSGIAIAFDFQNFVEARYAVET